MMGKTQRSIDSCCGNLNFSYNKKKERNKSLLPLAIIKKKKRRVKDRNRLGSNLIFAKCLTLTKCS